MIPLEVERLQTQLTKGDMMVEEFFGLMVAMFEFEDAKKYLRTVLHNIRILLTETVWGDRERYKHVYTDLVDRYQEFYCEEVDHQENIERYDWREGLENSKNSFEDLDQNDKFLENLKYQNLHPPLARVAKVIELEKRKRRNLKKMVLLFSGLGVT